MSAWMFWTAYVLLAITFYRLAYLALDAHDRREHPTLPVTGADRLGFAYFAMCGAMFWPLVAGLYVLYRVLTPTTPGEKAENLRKREERVRRMEREAGLR